MSDERLPAEGFPACEYVREGAEARGWDEDGFTRRFAAIYASEHGDDPPGIGELTARLVWNVSTPGCLLGKESALVLSRLFGTSEELWLNLDEAWQRWKAAQK